jgi:hypothetical protein
LIQVWRYEKALSYLKAVPECMMRIDEIFASTGRDLECGFFEVVTGRSFSDGMSYQSYLENVLIKFFN